MMKRTFFTIAVVLGALAIVAGAWAQGEWKSVTEPNQIFEEGYIQVTGISEEGQKRFAAVRAATVVAQRDLLEILEGLRLYGETHVRDGMLQSDQIRTTVQGFVRGAMKCGERYNDSKGYAEVCMRVNIRGKGSLYEVILPLIRDKTIMPPETSYYKPKLIPKAVTEAAPAPSQKEVAVTPPPVAPPRPPAAQVKETVKPEAVPVPPRPEVAKPSEIKVVFDGLIVDVREYPFKPALVNTVVTENDEVVFDPSKILSSVLVERGCGGFTTDPNKAKALLESWGSKNPMTLTGVGVLKMTNARITPDDASAVYVHDKQSSLLANARVVFLLK
jgi:hypothetical protein